MPRNNVPPAAVARFRFSTGLVLKAKRGSDSHAAWLIRHEGKAIAFGTSLSRPDAVRAVAGEMSKLYSPSLPRLPYKPPREGYSPSVLQREAKEAGWQEGSGEAAWAFLRRRWHEAMDARRAAVEVEVVDRLEE